MAPTAARETLRPARPGDAEGVLGLLGDAGLPPQGVIESLERFIVAEEDGTSRPGAPPAAQRSPP